MGYDVIVIGSGSGGATAAGAAKAAGAEVALIEKAKLGGVWTNTGCIPTKALLRSAEVIRIIRKSGEFGIGSGDVTIDFQEVMRRKDRIVRGIRESGLRNVAAAGITLIEGGAQFRSESELQVNGDVLTAGRYIIASGSVPVIPEIAGLAETGFITSNEALTLESLPGSIAIIGGSYVGLEFATFFNTLGVRTIVVEADARIARREDEEVSRARCRPILP